MKLSPYICPRPGSARYKAIAARMTAQQGGAAAEGPKTGAAASPEDAYAARAAEHVAMLREMSDVGMTLLRAVNRQAAAIAADPVDGAPQAGPAEAAPAAAIGDLALAHTRVTRAMRLTAVLELRLLDEARQRAAAPAAAVDDGGFSELSTEQVSKIRQRLVLLMTRQRAVVSAVRETLLDTGQDEDIVNGCCREISEQLVDHEKSEVLNHPISFTIGRILDDLGAVPDWSRWAETDWAKEEVLDAVPGSPYVPEGAVPLCPPPWRREGSMADVFGPEAPPDEESG